MGQCFCYFLLTVFFSFLHRKRIMHLQNGMALFLGMQADRIQFSISQKILEVINQTIQYLTIISLFEQYYGSYVSTSCWVSIFGFPIVWDQTLLKNLKSEMHILCTALILVSWTVYEYNAMRFVVRASFHAENLFA